MSERHNVRLPMVRIDRSPFSFISRTASAGSPVTSVEFSHSSGSVSVLEKRGHQVVVVGNEPVELATRAEFAVPGAIAEEPA